MKRTKKFLVGLLAALSVLSGSLGLAACGGNDSSASSGEATEIEKVYAQYVIYAHAEGQTPLSYEEWLATIKGEKGEKGDQGIQGEKGEKGEKGDKGDTGAQGEKGEKGDKGDTGATGAQGADGVGIEKVEYDENGDLKITFTDGTTQTVAMPASESSSLIDKGATEGLHYQKINGKEAYRVIGLGLAAESDIVISSTYKGLPITEIGVGAFQDCSSLTSVTIPDNVTSIERFAFYYCKSLTSVTIPDNVTSIGNLAFSDCSSLTGITFNGTVEEWNAIYKGNNWSYNIPATKVVCTDGEVEL